MLTVLSDGLFSSSTKSNKIPCGINKTLFSRLLTFYRFFRSSRKWIKLIKDPHAADQYTALLAIERAHPLDEGAFTCQAEDFNVQQCLSRQVKIGRRPTVKIEPMSLTVRKVSWYWSRLTIRLFSFRRRFSLAELEIILHSEWEKCNKSIHKYYWLFSSEFQSSI